jgi:hypothetical protein
LKFAEEVFMAGSLIDCSGVADAACR